MYRVHKLNIQLLLLIVTVSLCHLYWLNFAEQFGDLVINIDDPSPQDIFQNLDNLFSKIR